MSTKVKSEKRTKKSKSSKKKVKIEEPPVTVVEEKVIEEPVEVLEEPVTESVKATSVRRKPDKESVEKEFNDIIHSLSGHLESLKGQKGQNLKFLRSLNKQLKTLHSHTSRVLNSKRRTNRSSNTCSGFLKPVSISKEMCKFTGWDPKNQYSRVQVTKYICDYIKNNELQNPEDRRQIQVDKKLKKLLKYDKSSSPLTYYHLQTLLKPHFV